MHETAIAMGKFLMQTKNYYGWLVDATDPMYEQFIKENKDITGYDINEMSPLIEEHLKNKRVALDIGCHYGFFTKFLSETFESVHAFDFPNQIYNCLEKNVKKHNMDNVILHPYGLGEVNKKVATNDIFTRRVKGTKKDWFTKRGPLGNHIDPEGRNQKYMIKTLDSLKLKNIDLMMIDTEGYELNVLRGAMKTIFRYRPMLVVEFHKRGLTKKFGYRLDDLLRRILKLGYKSVGFINTYDQVFIPK